jgi:hypothetical protein
VGGRPAGRRRLAGLRARLAGYLSASRADRPAQQPRDDGVGDLLGVHGVCVALEALANPLPSCSSVSRSWGWCSHGRRGRPVQNGSSWSPGRARPGGERHIGVRGPSCESDRHDSPDG